MNNIGSSEQLTTRVANQRWAEVRQSYARSFHYGKIANGYDSPILELTTSYRSHFGTGSN
jgi:hypothetical protein